MSVTALLINLDRDTERLRWMEAELKRIGVEFKRVPAFLGDAIPEDYRARFVAPERSVLLPAERGCFASHLSALDDISRQGDDRAFLVSEDDVTFADDFAKILAHDCMRRPFDIIRLSDNPKLPAFMVDDCAAPYKIVRYSRIPNGSGAYLVSPAGARKVMRHAYGLDITFDDFLRRSWVTDLETLGVIPAPVRYLPDGVSSIDPGQHRKGARRRRYRCAHDSLAKRIASRIELGRQAGLVGAVKFLSAFGRMKLSGTKRDETGAYIVR